MIVLTDTGFHAKTGDPTNMKVCPRGTWNTRMLVETVLSMLTTVFHKQESGPSGVGILPCPHRMDDGGIQSLGPVGDGSGQP